MWHDYIRVDFTVFMTTCAKNTVLCGILDKVTKVYYN